MNKELEESLRRAKHTVENYCDILGNIDMNQCTETEADDYNAMCGVGYVLSELSKLVSKLEEENQELKAKAQARENKKERGYIRNEKTTH